MNIQHRTWEDGKTGRRVLSRFLALLVFPFSLLLCGPAAAQTQTPIYNLGHTNTLYPTNWIAIVMAPNTTNGTRAAQLSTLINMLNTALTNTQGTNLFTTNATVFPIFYQNNGNLLEFLSLIQGTNTVLYRTSTGIVVNATGTGGGGGGTQYFFDQTQFSTNAAGDVFFKVGALATNLSVLNFTNRGASTFVGIVDTQSNFTNSALANLNGVLIGGSLNVQGAASSFAQDLTITGPLTAETNAIVGGTNLTRWLQLTGGGGVPGTFGVFNSSSNLVGGIPTNSFTTHAQVVTASNAVIALLIANDTITSNGVVAFTMTASNTLRSLLVANDTITSNGAVAFTISASNTLDTKIENTVSNYYQFGYTVGNGFSNGTAKPIVTGKVNRMLEVMNLIAGANISLTAVSTGLVVTSTGASLSDGDYGDVTATGGGAVITIDNDVVTDAKLRESAGFSVIGKTGTGTGNPADILAGTDSIFGRSGSGNLTFGTLVTAQITDDAVTFAKIENVAENRIMGRDSTGTGNMEALTLGLNIDVSGGSVLVGPDVYFRSISLTNSIIGSNAWFRRLIITNTVEVGSSNTALATNIVIDWNGPPHITSYPTNTTFMLSFANAPAASNGLTKTIELRIVITNTPTMIAPSGVGWINAPVLRAGTTTIPFTNYFQFVFDGNTNIDALSLQTPNQVADTIVTNSVVYWPIYTNGVLIALGTNLDFVSGVTGYVSGSTVRLGITASGSGSSGTNFDSIRITNQVLMVPSNFNGSNGVSAIGLTNLLDTSLATFKAVTNRVGTNWTGILTNYLQGARGLMVFEGLGGTTNQVKFIAPSAGTNHKYLNIETNGDYDFLVRGGFTYKVDWVVERQTNVVFNITFDDPFVPVSTAYINALTNLNSAHWRLFQLLVPTNNAASNIVVNYGISNRVEIYLTNNATFTNYSGNVAGVSGTKQMWIWPQLIPRGVNWGLGIGYGVRVMTNAANPLWTSITNGKTYVVTDEWQGTNIIRTIALFE